MAKQRDIWVDNVKVIACLLVVLGHFFQSIVKAGIVKDTLLYEWFNATIYYFHVPLFFICSGYLFQKYSRVRSLIEWKDNVLKKLIALGVPYFVFSTMTWGLKMLFSSAVNDKVDGLFESLFIDPLSPYWYLYTLFFLFTCVFTVNKKIEMDILIVLGLFFKILTIFRVYSGIYAVNRIMENYIWFVVGMSIAFGYLAWFEIKKGILAGLVFIGISFIPYFSKLRIKGWAFIMGAIACYSVICIVKYISANNKHIKVFTFLSKYTMPIFLMHTLFAAPLRSVLLKFGVVNFGIHIFMGVAISIIGPIIAMIILEKIKPLDIIVYPRRYAR